jgi:hypothetical protein
MRFRLALILFLVTAFTAAAQFPMKVVTQYPSVYPAAEIHFVDGNVSHYPVKRIGKDLIRVETPGDQSIRMPLTYVESIRFKDGCTLFFENGQFRFDQLVQPALLRNESGDALLEGVLKLSKDQTEALMGPETYGAFRKNSRLLKVGIGTLATGTFFFIPYMSMAVLNGFQSKSPVQTFQEMNTHWKAISIGGGCLFVTGVVLAIIGNSGCNRVVATYNDGLGLAYSF